AQQSGDDTCSPTAESRSLPAETHRASGAARHIPPADPHNIVWSARRRLELRVAFAPQSLRLGCKAAGAPQGGLRWKAGDRSPVRRQPVAIPSGRSGSLSPPPCLEIDRPPAPLQVENQSGWQE